MHYQQILIIYSLFLNPGTSTEIYLYGTQYCYISLAILLSSTIMHFTIIPIFHELQITSTYEVCLTHMMNLIVYDNKFS